MHCLPAVSWAGYRFPDNQQTDKVLEIKKCSYDLFFFPFYPAPLQFALEEEHETVQPLQIRL
jgi:hypothetical protein